MRLVIEKRKTMTLVSKADLVVTSNSEIDTIKLCCSAPSHSTGTFDIYYIRYILF